LEIRFVTIKEMRKEIESLNRDKDKLESRCLQETIVEQIKIIQTKIDEAIKLYEEEDLDSIYNKNVFELIINRADITRGYGGFNPCSCSNIEVKIEYTAIYSKPRRETVQGEMIFYLSEISNPDSEDIMSIATRMLRQKLK